MIEENKMRITFFLPGRESIFHFSTYDTVYII
jgi:hypothetical protein